MVYLIPSTLQEDSVETIPLYVKQAVQACQLFFVEEERTARRFLKKLIPEIRIDDHEWVRIPPPDQEAEQVRQRFLQALNAGKTIGVISEAGCPGVADPGQELVALAHQQHHPVKPLVGPNSIVLALMASGLNGQVFAFNGYLPIAAPERIKCIQELELISARKKMTQIFMETPYRNNALVSALLNTCKKNTRLCLAANLTGPEEFIQTRTIGEWKTSPPDLHKRPTIFLLLAE
ncbi:MAG: SAM-dependent methyltransferase [Chitinophagaceae bacterium]